MYNQSMDIQDWHERYIQQSGWTAAARKYLITKLPSNSAGRILDVGFGTGAVKNEWPEKSRFVGIDLKYEGLVFAKENSSQDLCLVNGDTYHLPYKDHCFDLVSCHFLLLWITHPAEVLSEMVRVCRSGGRILFFAEPDYGARIDYPQPLEALGNAQIASLQEQGADPEIGRKVLELASAAGLVNIEVGIIGYQTSFQQDDKSFWENEWRILRYDLAGSLSEASLADLQRIDTAARQSGSRILFVPTFYLYAEVP